MPVGDKLSPAAAARAELLTEHNACRIRNRVQEKDDMPLHIDTVHGLDAALTPLNSVVHAALYNLRSAGNVVHMTGETLHTQTFHTLRMSAKAFADLESTRPISRDHNEVLVQTMALFDAVTGAVADLDRAKDAIERALTNVARGVDELVDVVKRRRFEVFGRAVADRATVYGLLGEDQRLEHLTEPPACYLCLDPVPPDGAGWIAGPPCTCVEPVLSCRPCFMRTVMEMTECGRKSFGRCPHCRAEFVWSDVRLTGPRRQ